MPLMKALGAGGGSGTPLPGPGRRFFFLPGPGIPILVLLMMFRAGASAQDVQRPLRHEVSVVLKLIQVVVTDKDGNPVTGLQKGDFALFDNGREMKITDFEQQSLSLPSEGAKAGEARIHNTPLPSPRLLNRKFFLLFDFALNNPAGVRKMGQAARAFLDSQIRPSDEIGVLTYSVFGLLQMPIDLTTDHAKVRGYIGRIGLRQSSQRIEDLETQYQRDVKAGGIQDARPEMKLSRPVPAPPEYDPEANLYFSSLTYVDCMTALAYALRSVPGQKNLILFSDGLPYSSVYPIIPGELTRRHENFLKEMATSNVAIHALRTAGITLGDTKSGAWTLDKTSYETGGQYWGNMFNYQPFLEKVQAMTGSYYVLGYPINETWDGRYHKIEVRVDRPGCRVRAQAGYLNPKEYADFTPLEKQVHLVDLALAAKPLLQDPLRFPLAALSLAPDGADNIGIAAEVPLRALREAGLGKVEILRLAFDAGDKIVDSRRTEEDLRLRRDASAALVSFLTGPPGRVRCRVIVRDLETGRAAVAAASAYIPDPKVKDVRILPPLFLRPGRPGFSLKEAPPGRPEKGAAPKTAAGSLFFDPALYSPDLSDRLKSGTEVRAVVSCIGPSGNLAGAKFTLTIIDSFKDEAHPVSVVIEEDHSAAGIRVLRLRFRVPALEADDYRLIFSVEGPEGSLSRIARDFSIEGAGA